MPFRETRRSVVGFVLGFGLACSALLAPQGVHAGEEFAVREYHTEVVDGVIRLDARIDFDLPDVLLDALRNGVGLVFEIEVYVLRQRDWLPDAEVAHLTQRYSLLYHALSQQYLLENHNTGERMAYPSLGSALYSLGQVNDYPMLDASLLHAGEHYEASLRVRLAYEELPIPLRMRAYVSAEWRPASNWYQWPLP